MWETSMSNRAGVGAVKQVPHSVEAGEEVPRPPGESALFRELRSLCERVAQVAPACRGTSVTWTESRVTCTLVASDAGIAVLDAVQYVGGGPTLDVVTRGQGVEADVAALPVENTWGPFARATLARGFRSVLALPLTQHGRVAGTVTFYGGTSNAFEGAHAELIRLLEAWAPQAIAVADLALPDRLPADRPQTLRDQGMINRAVATLATARDGDAIKARELLDDAAARAGVSSAQVAEALLQPHA